MKKIYLYILLCLVAATSCVKSMDEPCKYPIAGKWAMVNSDGSVAKYILFEAGKYYEFESEVAKYYLNKKIWRASKNDFIQVELQGRQYSIRDGRLHRGDWSDEFSIADGILKIGNHEYLPFESFESDYGFKLTHDIPANANKIVEYSAAPQDVVWNYQIKELPKGNKLTVSANATWIKSVQVSENQIKFILEENSSISSRSTVVSLSHPAINELQLTLRQNLSGPQLSSYSTNSSYVGGNYELAYSIVNPREDVQLEASTDVSWITDVVLDNGVLTFKVTENNSGSSRVGNIVLTYGSVKVLHNVTQSYSAILLSCNPASTSCNYKSVSKSFTYTLENPREGVSLKVSCSEQWITNIIHNGTTVSFEVEENNSGSSREGNIVLTYGSETVKHKVTQSYTAPIIVCNPISTSCDYGSHSKEFTYTLYNSREGISVNVSCAEAWITDIVHDGAKVQFNVTSNDNITSRTGNIVLNYGPITINHPVEQAPMKETVLSSSGTANCYIVSEKGAYKFSAVKGNSNTSVGDVASAVVLWESFGTSTAPNTGDLLKSVSFNNGDISFKTADTYNEGNAVIAAMDASGKILWSWHIWLTDQPQEQVYYNNAGIVMDRNLGATSATLGDVAALGLLYQWGRKDPFLGSISTTSITTAKSTITWPSAVVSDSTHGTIEYAVANPTKFIKYNNSNNSNYDWYYTGSSSTDNTRWTESSTAKSIYDPCPSGWRVPDGGGSGLWARALEAFDGFYYSFGKSNKGLNFSGKFGAASTIWYPTPGYIPLYAMLDNVGSQGYYWSATPRGNYVYILSLDISNDYVIPSEYTFRSLGASIRCVKD